MFVICLLAIHAYRAFIEEQIILAEAKTYTAQQLRAKQNSELADICKVVGVAVSGKKDVRIKRILDAQGSKEN